MGNILSIMGKNHHIKAFEVEQSLKMCPDLICQDLEYINKKHLDRLRFVAVCYHLLNDQENKKEINKIHKESKHDNKVKTSPSEQKFLHKQHVATSSHSDLYHDQYYKYLDNTNTVRWNIGLNVTSQPQKLMMNVLESLKSMQMEWFFIRPYCIMVRKVSHKNEERIRLKFRIQVYSSSKSYTSSHFILDIHKISGHSFPFLNACKKLMALKRY